MSPAPPSLRKSLRLTTLNDFAVRPSFPCYPDSRQTFSGLVSTHHMSRVFSLQSYMVPDGQRSANDKKQRSSGILGLLGVTSLFFLDLVYSPHYRTGVGSEPRVPRVLRFSEHGRERGSEDRRQLLRWKLLVDEAQRLDQGNGVHNVAHQSQRPPGVVRGELQEP